MPEFILDTNILIGVLRGDRDLATFVENLDCAIETTIYVELIQGAKNKIEVARIERAIRQFQLFHFDGMFLVEPLI